MSWVIMAGPVTGLAARIATEPSSARSLEQSTTPPTGNAAHCNATVTQGNFGQHWLLSACKLNWLPVYESDSGDHLGQFLRPLEPSPGLFSLKARLKHHRHGTGAENAPFTRTVLCLSVEKVDSIALVVRKILSYVDRLIDESGLLPLQSTVEPTDRGEADRELYGQHRLLVTNRSVSRRTVETKVDELMHNNSRIARLGRTFPPRGPMTRPKCGNTG